MLQRPHSHPSRGRHLSKIPHTHSIRDTTYSTTSWRWNPSTIWTRNNVGNNAVSVSWTTSESTTASKTVSLQVGVTDSVVSSQLGSSFTSSHTISTSHTRTYQVPFRRDGRVLVTFNRQRANFTCVTTYNPIIGSQYEKTGACTALGGPTNIVAQLETRLIKLNLDQFLGYQDILRRMFYDKNKES